MRRNFDTKISVDGSPVQLNFFVQEAVANTTLGFLKALKGKIEEPCEIEISIRRLKNAEDVKADG